MPDKQKKQRKGKNKEDAGRERSIRRKYKEKET
jgi:hypothetical protein